MQKTLAQQLAQQFELIPENERGFKDYDLLEGFRARCHYFAEKVVEACPESYDSGIFFLFHDGSKLYLANPRQEAYGAFIHTDERYTRFPF